MPLFRRSPPVDTVETSAAPNTSSKRLSRQSEPVVEDRRRSSGFFGRKRDVSPTTTTTTSTTNHTPTHTHSVLHRGTGFGAHEDSSITNARERVLSAEAAEKDADRALNIARQAVKEAREHVKRLEREAKEEARLASIKMKQAGDLGKRGKLLGRHDHT